MNKTIEELVNQKFDPISKKIDNISLEIKLQKSEIQINKILQTYDKLSKNKLSFEEKYEFAQYLLNLYNKANKLITIKRHFIGDINKINDAINMIKNSDIHNKVIGIDNFMALAHTNSSLLPDLVAIVNDGIIIYEDTVEFDEISYIYYLKWRLKIDDKIVKKLNEIRNRKGLSKFEYTEA